MDLSIIIVSYNSLDFLHNTLLSVEKAIRELKAEVWVIDNASSDGSIAYLRPKFPRVQFLEAGSNLGFAKANNRGLAMATGKFVLFLNPDVLIAENSLRICVDFMNAHADAGVLGVRMIDGSGNFLPESKRGFPGLWNSACRFLRLSSIFPGSKLFAGYYLGHLANDRPAEIDVVSGAFMMVAKKVVDQAGGFDERYFMYGEDIDLSYTIQKAGYRNYYLPQTTIIHFKGESTTRDKSYYRHFYGAMDLFASKHLQRSLVLLKPLIITWKALAARKAGSGEEKAKPPQKLSLSGDSNSIAEARRIIEHNKLQVSDAGEGLVLCQGQSFSFHALIDKISAGKSRPYLIHCAGTAVIIFSPDSSKTGVVLKTPD